MDTEPCGPDPYRRGLSEPGPEARTRWCWACWPPSRFSGSHRRGTGPRRSEHARNRYGPITGTVGIGKLLTAHASGITDADGLTNPNFFFLWLDQRPPTPAVASSPTRYHVLPLDAGLRIMVASFYDDAAISRLSTAWQPPWLRPAPAPPGDLTASSTAPGELSLLQGPSGQGLARRALVGGGSDRSTSAGTFPRMSPKRQPGSPHHHEPHRGQTYTDARHRYRGGRQRALPRDHAGGQPGAAERQPVRSRSRASASVNS